MIEIHVKLVSPFEQSPLGANLRLNEAECTYENVYKAVEDEFGLEHGRFSLISYSGVKLTPLNGILNGDVIQVCPSVLGGKGGFGSLLRAFGKQITMSTNKDACRDLTGRRIKQVNNEKKMREFLEKQAERAKQKEEAKLEKRKRRREKLSRLEEGGSRHVFVDPKFNEQKEKIDQELQEALDRGIKARQKSSASAVVANEKTNDNNGSASESDNTARSGQDTVATTSAAAAAATATTSASSEKKVNKNDINSKLIDWMGVGDVDVSSSSSDEEPKPAKSIYFC